MARTLAVDLGGTRMRAALVSPDGDVEGRSTAPTPRDAECPDALLALVAGVRTTDATAAVVGAPGRVDYAAGRLEHAPNIPAGWLGELSERRLSDVLGVPVSLANDADLAAVGEWRYGAGRGFTDVAYITISTGIGAGVVLGGRLAHGRRSLGEIGHTVIDRLALARGRSATLEGQGSGTALARMATDARIDEDGARLVELARSAGHPAQGIWASALDAIGIGVANLALLFSPQVVVVGGGVGRSGSEVLDAARDALAKLGPQGLPEPITVSAAALGDDAGLIGAAAWSEAFDRTGLGSL